MSKFTALLSMVQIGQWGRSNAIVDDADGRPWHVATTKSLQWCIQLCNKQAGLAQGDVGSPVMVAAPEGPALSFRLAHMLLSLGRMAFWPVLLSASDWLGQML